MYLRALLFELGFEQQGPTPIYIDNEPALWIINDNSTPTERVRHVAIRYFALQDWCRIDKSIIMIHIPGIINPSDDYTKPLGAVLHCRHCRRIMGHYGRWSSFYILIFLLFINFSLQCTMYIGGCVGFWWERPIGPICLFSLRCSL